MKVGNEVEGLLIAYTHYRAKTTQLAHTRLPTSVEVAFNVVKVTNVTGRRRRSIHKIFEERTTIVIVKFAIVSFNSEKSVKGCILYSTRVKLG